MATLFWALVVLGILIFVHELGHFLTARFFGVRVLVFSLGFGPRLGGWRDKSGTEYQVSAIPLGGYVKMLGEGDDEDTPVSEEDRQYSFAKKGVWSRFSIVFAGPAFNFIFAVFALSLAFMVGVGEPLPVVGPVTVGMPAQEAGIQTGDQITYIGEQPIASWDELSQTIKASEGGPLSFTVERDGQTFQLTITPQTKEVVNLFGEKVKFPLIGIAPSGEKRVVNYGPLEAVAMGATQSWRMIELTVTSIWKLITQVVSPDQIGGPLMIAEMAGKTASQGTTNLLFFMALISINLGILNLLPIPILDGGHLFFFLVEAVKGSPVSETVQGFANRIGMGLLLLLMVWALKNDLMRIFAS
ncbi:MAG: RIP metalloprotease RseP [Magnetococcales bacterium]|nr:RIP metalloprotease RseP [Magnetococcales bacterium]